MTSAKTSSVSEIIPRLYVKLLPVQIILVIIGGANAIIDNGFAGNLIGPDGLAAYSAIFSFSCIYWCVPAGASSAVMVLGSVYAGEEDKTGLTILMKTFLKKGLGLAIFAGLASGHRIFYSSLCTEELAGNIVRHVFKDKKKHSIDIRVSYIDDEIVICFKDDGIPFNPEESSRLFCAEDTVSQKDAAAFDNIGLRLASRISRSMNYQNTFGLNILTIKV